MRIGGASDSRATTGGVPQLPERVPTRAMAPDWSSPTDSNGSGLARADLHIALVAGNPEEAALLARVKVIQPPLWDGKVHLHVIVNEHNFSEDDIHILQAMVDLGWADSRDVHIGPPAGLTLGYPSGTDE